MATNYIYPQSAFTNGLNISQLQDEIDSVFSDFLGLNKLRNIIEAVFSRALNASEYNSLSAIISAHVPKTIPPVGKNGIVNLLQLHQPIIIYSVHSIGFFPWQSARYPSLSNGLCLFSCDDEVKIEIYLASELLGSLTTISGGSYTFPVSLPRASSGTVEVRASKISTRTKIIALSLEWSL